MKFIFINIINVYQKNLSPVFGRHCRYSPSCSEYAKTSILKKGLFYGIGASCLRILSCNPWSKKKIYDPVK